MRKLNLMISVLIGLAIFIFFFYKSGIENILSILKNINLFYLFIYFCLTTLTFVPMTLRWKVILKAYKKKVSFWELLKENFAGYAVSYITPTVRLGGEPLRAYMLKKNANVDLKTGTSSIIMDKFVEFVGAVLFGFFGLIVLFLIPTSFYLKLVLAILIGVAFFLLSIFYYRTLTGRGSFSSLFNLLRLYKISKIKNFIEVIKEVEEKLKRFFKEHKKEFLISFLWYLVYGIIGILEFKFLLLGLGVNANVFEIVLVLFVLGTINFIPIPASLGFLEAGQSSLFYLLRGSAGLGFALSLIIRLKSLILIAFGFSIISYFSSKQIEKKYKKVARKVEKNI